MAGKLSQGVAEMTLSDREERVTQKQLNTLADKIGVNWENLAIDLGLSDADVDTCKANNLYNVRSQKFDMLMMWRARAREDATAANLVQKLRDFGIDEEKFEFLLPHKEQTDSQESGLAVAATPVEPGQTALATSVGPAPTTSVDPRLLQLLKQATAIVQKTNPGVDFTKNEEEMLQKIKEWEAPLKKRVENFSSSINYSIDYEGFSAINDCMKSVCLIEHPKGSGTGFLIGLKYVMTANHVLPMSLSFLNVPDPQRPKFLVHFQISGTKRLTFIFRPDNIAARDDTLDYAIFEIHPDPVSPTDHSVSETVQSEGICPLGTKIVTSVGEDIVVVVGHPGGGRKRVDFCSVVAVDAVTNQAITLFGQPDYPQKWPQESPDMGSYHTSVMFEGSSGSPCFTKHGDVVFMHTHGFRPYRDRESIVEMGVLLSSVKTDAKGKLSSEVFTEIFGS